VSLTFTSAWLAMEFPDRLAQLRKAKGLTLRALAELAEVHVTQIQRYESGDSQPTLDVIKRLAIALSVSADTLIFDMEERGPDDVLKLQFEAVKQFDQEDKALAQGLLEGLILKHQAKQHVRRTTLAVAQATPPPTSRERTKRETSRASTRR
jgi:transcriptional regulator with XRE-family HTH domain